MNERRYWIAVVPRDHADAAVANGFVELSYGRAEPLARMHPGDGLLFYSPRERLPDGDPLQAFTAIGRIGDGPIFEAPPPPAPIFRRGAQWLDATPASIRPLIDDLTFIRNKAHWGAAFRFGVLRVPPADFAAIARAMGRDASADFA
jgi:EVE domain-containing protein